MELNFKKAKSLADATKIQNKSDLWRQERKHRFTSLNVTREFFSNMCLNISHLNCVKHVIKQEPNARRLYKEKTNNIVFECGLIVHPYIPDLGTSPDGVVLCGSTNAYGLIEIKCPSSKKFIGMSDAVKFNSFCLKRNENNMFTMV